MKITVREVHVRTVLVKSRISGVRFAVNPYGGCSHGCAYCYAAFMQRLHSRSEAWGRYLDVKANAPEVLERDIKQLKTSDRGTVLLSSVCDPYPPEEVRYRLTRRILAMLLNHGFPVSILTKSGIAGGEGGGPVRRDMDLMKGFAHIEVGLTITGLSEPDRRLLEPRASPHNARISALKELKEAGISTWAFIGPVLPGLTDPDMVFQDLSGLVDHALVDRLNLRSGTWARFGPFLMKHYPKLFSLYQDIHRGNHEVWDDTMVSMGKLAKKHGVRIRVV